MSDPYAGGIGGPRRKTPDEQQMLPPVDPNSRALPPESDTAEPVDTAAANAEAGRLARELGLDTSINSASSRTSNTKASSRRAPQRDPHGSSVGANYRRMDDSTGSTNHSRGSYVPPDPLNDSGVTMNESEQQHPQPEIHVFDSHGQRTPYKEGPYFVTRSKEGRVFKKRWCEYIQRRLSVVWLDLCMYLTWKCLLYLSLSLFLY